MKNSISISLVSIFIMSCGGGGGSKDNGGTANTAEIPRDFTSVKDSSWNEESKQLEFRIEFKNYLPEYLRNTEIEIFVDSDDSNTVNSGDLRIKIFKSKSCRIVSENSERCTIKNKAVVYYDGVYGDARGFEYAVSNGDGSTILTIVLHDIISRSSIVELKDGSLSLRISTIQYDSLDEDRIELSKDYLPNELGLSHMMDGDQVFDNESDYSGPKNTADIKSVKVVNYISRKSD